MDILFLVSAVAGGTILIIQILLLLVGFDDGGDAGGVGDVGDLGDGGGEFDVDSGEGASGEAAAASFTVISFKTLTAFFTFFGLGGLLGKQYAIGNLGKLGLAVVAGLLAFYLVGYVWMLLYRLQSKGNINIRNAVGGTGRVYLRIPGKGTGAGKVTLHVQGRNIEVKALTTGEEIPTGAQVRVVGLVASDTVKVIPAEDVKEASHG